MAGPQVHADSVDASQTLLARVCSKRIGSLYGIRAVAALVVVFYHQGLSTIPGTYGVTAFFVLSGFLITHLLVMEEERTGTISLRDFYIRRTFRIFPAFYVYALVVIVGHLVTRTTIHWVQVISSLTYTGNYYLAFVHDVAGTMSHTWSLAVEEQFYLLWPFLFKRFRHRRGAVIKGLAVVIVAVWVFRLAMSLANAHPDYLYYSFEARLDALAIGCFVALVIHQGYQFRWLVASPLLAIPLVAAIACMPYIDGIEDLPFYPNAVITNALLPVVCAALIVNSVYYSRHPLYWILNNPVAEYLGLISYSLYLYHPVLVHHSMAGTLSPMVALAIAGSVVAASGSYFLVELPFLRLKSIYARVTASRNAARHAESAAHEAAVLAHTTER